MNPQLFEVYLARLHIGQSRDFRPCVVVDILKDSNIAVVALTSSELHGASDFRIDKDATEFSKTGLARTSYALAEGYFYIPISDLGPRKGCLSGALLHDFQRWLD